MMPWRAAERSFVGKGKIQPLRKIYPSKGLSGALQWVKLPRRFEPTINENKLIKM